MILYTSVAIAINTPIGLHGWAIPSCTYTLNVFFTKCLYILYVSRAFHSSPFLSTSLSRYPSVSLSSYLQSLCPIAPILYAHISHTHTIASPYTINTIISIQYIYDQHFVPHITH